MRNFKERADTHTVSCFFNSLLREWSNYRIVDKAVEIGDNPKLRVGFRLYSILGRHEYSGEYTVTEAGVERAVSAIEAIQFTCEYVARHYGEAQYKAHRLLNRILASRSNIEESLELRGDKASVGSFLESEQALLIGHNFHPTPKSREGFEVEDMQRYSPEFGGRFKLKWLMADPSILFSKTAGSFALSNWSLSLLKTEQTEPTSDLTDRVAYPVHPWQFERLKQNPAVAEYLTDGRLEILGESKEDWFPTSSLRSIYRQTAPFMLKFSMTLKLTNSVRHLLQPEVERGLQLFDVLQTTKGKEFLDSEPHFSVIGEPAYMALLDQEGRVLEESIVVCRENPFTRDHEDTHAVLASLTQDALMTGENAIRILLARYEIPARIWFRHYLAIAVKPIMLAQGNYGIVLGAHQQNLILGLRSGLPVQSWFRDCQGTGYTELGYSFFADDVPLIERANGNVVDRKLGQSLFVYYLILNSTFNVITALRTNTADEVFLLRDLKEFISDLLASGITDPSYLESLLQDEHLMHKGNFACSFQNLNENTTADPTSIYVPVLNSIRAQGPPNAEPNQ